MSRRPRRLIPYYRANCNGGPDGTDRLGCPWSRDSATLYPIREEAEHHAATARHEVVLVNLNDGLVLDGRPR